MASAFDQGRIFVEWVTNKQKELCDKSCIPQPTTIIIFDPAPSVSIMGWPIFRSVLLGYYERDTGTINVFFYKWNGSDQTLDYLKNVWLHEWLHHYDLCYGIPCQEPHNDWYMQRLVLMGLWEGNEGL